MEEIVEICTKGNKEGRKCRGREEGRERKGEGIQGAREAGRMEEKGGIERNAGLMCISRPSGAGTVDCFLMFF